MALLTAALLCVWGVLLFRQAQQRQRIETLQFGTEILEVVPEPNSHLAIYRAELLSEDVIPPRLPEAEESVQRAIQWNAFNSSHWLMLARLQVLQGETEEARQALLRSEELDPTWPTKNLKSLWLWIALGEQDRAKALAKGMAEQDMIVRKEAIEELGRAGLPVAEIYEVFAGDSEDPELILQVLEVLRSVRPKGAQLALAEVPDSALQDSRIRNTAAILASSSLNYPVAQSLWRRLAGLEPLPPGSVWIENGDLSEEPTVHDRYFGWRSLEGLERVEAVWHPKLHGAKGVLALDLGRSTATGEGRAKLYDLLVPEGRPLRVRVRYRLSEGFESKPVFDLNGAPKGAHLRTPEPKPGEWQEAVAELPPLESAMRMEVVFRRATGNKIVGPEQVVLDSLTLEERAP